MLAQNSQSLGMFEKSSWIVFCHWELKRLRQRRSATMRSHATPNTSNHDFTSGIYVTSQNKMQASPYTKVYWTYHIILLLFVLLRVQSAKYYGCNANFPFHCINKYVTCSTYVSSHMTFTFCVTCSTIVVHIAWIYSFLYMASPETSLHLCK